MNILLMSLLVLTLSTANAFEDIETESCDNIGSFSLMNINVEFIEYLDCMHAVCGDRVITINGKIEPDAEAYTVKDLGDSKKVLRVQVEKNDYKFNVESQYSCVIVEKDSHSH